MPNGMAVKIGEMAKALSASKNVSFLFIFLVFTASLQDEDVFEEHQNDANNDEKEEIDEMVNPIWIRNTDGQC